MDKYTVYAHINKTNGKVYIGQTKQKPEDRWLGGYGYKEHHPHFWAAILKYGWDGFDHIILKENLDADEANFYEKKYIQEYKSADREFGYNIMSGGEDRPTPNGKAVCQYDFDGNLIATYPSYMEAGRAVGTDGTSIKRAAFSERNSLTLKGYFWRPEGTFLTKEEIQDILQQKEGNKQKGLALGRVYKSTPCVKIDIATGEVLAEYSSFIEAAKANGTYYSKVSNHCKMKKKNNRLKTSYIFQLKEDYKENEWYKGEK